MLAEAAQIFRSSQHLKAAAIAAASSTPRREERAAAALKGLVSFPPREGGAAPEAARASRRPPAQPAAARDDGSSPAHAAPASLAWLVQREAEAMAADESHEDEEMMLSPSDPLFAPAGASTFSL